MATTVNCATVKGEYVIEVLKANGHTYYPFGEKPLNNLILDTFFVSILNGYPFGTQGYIQSCNAGDNSTPPSRTDQNILGALIDDTRAGSFWTPSVNADANTISQMRDFIFPVVSAPSITYTEFCVGCFGLEETNDIATSRFVLPTPLTLFIGDQLKIIYTLNINLPYLNTDVPVSLSGGGYIFDGKIRMSATNVGLVGFTGSNTFLGNNLTIWKNGANNDFYNYRQYNSQTKVVNQATNSSYGIINASFGTNRLGLICGFWDPFNHVPRVYPNSRLAFTPLGPTGTVTFHNSAINDSYASIDAKYYFPPHTSTRVTSGFYIWYNAGVNAAGLMALYYKLDYLQTIPASVPIEVNLRWYFTRETPPPTSLPSGGTITEFTSAGDLYRVHTFTSSDTFTLTDSNLSVDYLIVGGGGGSNFDGSGGGGAGGVLTGNTTLTPADYNITVGAGGNAGIDAGTILATNGGNSIFNGLTAIGGGASGRYLSNAGSTGGSGGGGGSTAGSGGSGTPGQGFNGGNATGNLLSGGAGGGGGASQAGNNGNSSPSSKGGDGILTDITGIATYYAGGGGGGTASGTTASTGGLGGGGNGNRRGSGTSTATDGLSATGGGAGGTGDREPTGRNGGSGVVIIRYKI